MSLTSLRGRGPRTALALFLVLFLVGCFNATAKKVIVGANEVQDAAKNAFNDAKAQVEANGKACGAKARAQVPPVTPSPEACAMLGLPFPYDPVKMNELVGPINALYEAVRAAEATRLAWRKGHGSKGDVVAQVTLALEAISRVFTAADDLGVKLDRTQLDEVIRKWAEVTK